MDDDASDVLAAMLSLSRPHEAKLKEERSPPLPEAEIVAEVAGARRREGAPPPPEAARVPGILRRLAADTSEVRLVCTLPCLRLLSQRGALCLTFLRACFAFVQLITCVGEGHGGPAYCVNTKRIIDLIRMKEARRWECW